MASSDLQVLRRYTYASKLYQGLTSTATAKSPFLINFHSMITFMHPKRDNMLGYLLFDFINSDCVSI